MSPSRSRFLCLSLSLALYLALFDIAAELSLFLVEWLVCIIFYFVPWVAAYFRFHFISGLKCANIWLRQRTRFCISIVEAESRL